MKDMIKEFLSLGALFMFLAVMIIVFIILIPFAILFSPYFIYRGLKGDWDEYV